MSDLRDLYQQTILDHTRQPRNRHEMPDATAAAHGHNPLCGDKITLYLKMNNGVIEDISFTGSGCAICTASASMMTEALKGKTIAQVQHLFNAFHTMLTGPMDQEPDIEKLDKLAVFSGVREFPVRVKCATLPWHTLQAALKNDPHAVSTQ
ncbi:MAG: SUF system NifU family Fe-S cluster assembly protein [Planctomycetia bacterium]|nr:SUF system NifU family Fe-S cluster assembly protein [Planctomycetia bacterium]